MKIYLGHGKAKDEVFRSETTPTEATHGKDFVTCTGPFKTVRGAKAMLWFGYNNPHMQTVSEAERIGLRYADALMNMGMVNWKN